MNLGRRILDDVCAGVALPEVLKKHNISPLLFAAWVEINFVRPHDDNDKPAPMQVYAAARRLAAAQQVGVLASATPEPQELDAGVSVPPFVLPLPRFPRPVSAAAAALDTLTHQAAFGELMKSMERHAHLAELDAQLDALHAALEQVVSRQSDVDALRKKDRIGCVEHARIRAALDTEATQLREQIGACNVARDGFLK